MAERLCFGLDKKRYETKGIEKGLPIEYRFILWQLIDELDEKKRDYLQIFDFVKVHGEGGREEQKIIHRQEAPQYSKTYDFSTGEKPITGKVFVIDDGEQCTMLWAEEY